jgi:hypothetical protein
MKKKIRIPGKRVCLSLVFFICVCLIASDAFSLNAPVTPEMLFSLRALGGGEVARSPMTLAPVGEKGEIISMPRKQRKMGLNRRDFSLSGYFNITICTEGIPHTQFPIEDYSFDYSVRINERLIDALDRLVEVFDGHVLWRLLEGRLVITTTAKDDTLPIGDRMLEVDIDAETIGEAFLQLEKTYNEQFTDIPFIFHTKSVDFSDFISSTGDPFRVEGKKKLRNILILLVNQWDPEQAHYRLESYGGNRYDIDKKHVRQYYYDNELYYYGLTIHDVEADARREKERRPVNRFEELTSEKQKVYYRWLDEKSRAETQRLMGYFDRIYPEWAAEEKAASVQEK